MTFPAHETKGLVYLTAPLLARSPGVIHGFSTRLGGVSEGVYASLNFELGHGDAPEAVGKNLARFSEALGVDAARAVFSRQVHEATVRLCTQEDAGKGPLRERDYTADALITREPGLPLTVFSADCGTLLLYDPIHHAAGAVHSGWRSCAAGIVEKTVQAMEAAFGSQPRELLCALGPCIGACCFETDRDVPDAMRAALGQEAEPFLRWDGAKYHVDLAGLNRQWLLHAGVLPDQIEVCGLCTGCHPEWFWSHRKMGTRRGAQVAVIALREREEACL